LYQNLVKLYAIWKPRLERTVLQEQSKLLDQKMKNLPLISKESQLVQIFLEGRNWAPKRYDELKLTGLSGAAPRRLAIVNNQTFASGESAREVAGRRSESAMQRNSGQVRRRAGRGRERAEGIISRDELAAALRRSSNLPGIRVADSMRAVWKTPHLR
jgi:hypothetical protein